MNFRHTDKSTEVQDSRTSEVASSEERICNLSRDVRIRGIEELVFFNREFTQDVRKRMSDVQARRISKRRYLVEGLDIFTCTKRCNTSGII